MLKIITLYRTPSPGTSVKSGEYWEIALTATKDGQYKLAEYHGFWDETAEHTRRDAPPAPTGEPRFFDSSDAGMTAWEAQKKVRARLGFMHGLVPDFNPMNPPNHLGIYEFVSGE
jgi:hypothetical protein